MYVSVLGAGQMGSGIAQVFATHTNYKVKLYDISQEALEKAKKKIAESLTKLSFKCLIDKSPDEILNNISYHDNLSDLSGSQIFIESAIENFDIKSNLLYKISEYLEPNTFVATNTSSYSISSMANMVKYPENFIGFHFMNPPPLMELMEIIKSNKTSEETFIFFWELAKNLKKIPIQSADSPGFVLNRILIPMINEAAYVLYSGIASENHIDAAMKLGANHPMGPLALADLIGLDTVLSILNNMYHNFKSEKYKACPIFEQYISEGRFGKKSKIGFHKYF